MVERQAVDQAFEGRPKVLFMDDDPMRGEIFLNVHPDAVLVATAEECIARLAEPWDEVHLDHDLGGEVFVGHERDDCGMAVVRWLCDQPRPHLKTTRFFVHSHNLNAACLMVLHLETVGYHVQVRPFGVALPRPARSGRLRSLVERAIRWLRTGGNHGMAPMADGDQAGSSEGHESERLE